MKTISLFSALLVSAATTACVSEHNDARDPLDLGSIELPDPNARVDESALFDQFLAGESVRRPVVMVDESLFVKFDLKERTVWTQILPKMEEAELAEQISGAAEIEIQLGHLTLPSDIAARGAGQSASAVLAALDRPGLVVGGQAGLTVDPVTFGSPPLSGVNVMMLDSLYGIAPECTEHSWWEECAASSLNAECGFVAQVPCNSWTWVQEQIQVTCTDGRVVPSYKWNLQVTQYNATLRCDGKCTSLDFPYFDWTTPDDGCYCVVTKQPACPQTQPPAAPAPPAAACDDKKCTPKMKVTAAPNGKEVVEVMCEEDVPVETLEVGADVTAL